MKLLSPTKEKLEKHYEDLADKPFFKGLVTCEQCQRSCLRELNTHCRHEQWPDLCHGLGRPRCSQNWPWYVSLDAVQWECCLGSYRSDFWSQFSSEPRTHWHLLRARFVEIMPSYVFFVSPAVLELDIDADEEPLPLGCWPQCVPWL